MTFSKTLGHYCPGMLLFLSGKGTEVCPALLPQILKDCTMYMGYNEKFAFIRDGC